MEWKWPTVDDRGLARFVNSVAGNSVRLPENRQDLLHREDGRRQLIEAIYNALLNLDKKIRYAPEKYHPSEATQLIRKPCEIINSPGEGTCLDLAAFFCGVCLANDLLPFLIVLEGHALAAVSLNHGLQKWDAYERREKELFRDKPLTDISELRNLVDSGQYLVIECTGFAQSHSLPDSVPEGNGRIDGFLSFDRAIVVGRQQLDQTERPLRFALDIAVAHYRWGIEPLSQATESPNHHLKGDGVDVNPQLLGANLQNSIEVLQQQLLQHQQLISSVNGTPENLTDERHSRIEDGCKLIRQGKPKQALQYLTDLKAELWEKKLDPIIKYRLLANIGMAKLGLEQISEAADAFIEAKQYNPEDEKALAFAAMGYTLQENSQQAEELIQVVLQKNSANSIVHSLRVQMAPSTDSIEEIVNRVPLECRNSPDVMAALGQAALDRELYNEAEKYFQAVIDQSQENTDNIRALLGFTLVKSISQDFPLILAGQIDSIKREKLERALSIFTQSWGGSTPSISDFFPGNLTVLVNRSNVLRLLKRYDEAIDDIEIALKLEPENQEFIRHRALLAVDKGEISQAITYLQKIIANHNNYEVLILISSLMLRESRFQEAIDLLENFILTNQIEEYQIEAERLQIHLYLGNKNYEKAREISQSLLDDDPNNIINLVAHISVLLRTDSKDSIQVFIEQAKAALELNTDIRDLVTLADLLYYLESYRDAVEVYEKFVDKKLNNHFTYRLLNSYFYAGDYESAINLCEELINQHGIDVLIPHVSEIATFIYQSIDEFPSVRKVCEEYLRLVPNDISMQLRLAVMNYETENFEDLEIFLDSNPNIDNLSFYACKQLAILYKVTNKLDNFFEIIYRIRQQFHDYEQAHTFYITSYAEGMNLYVKLPYPEQNDIKPLHLPITISGIKVFSSLAFDSYCHQSFQKVESTCGVFLINKFKSNNAKWYILDENLNKNFSSQELCPTDTLYQKLIGNSLGHEVKISDNPLNKNSSLIIAAITDKYFAANHISSNFVEDRPEIQGFSIAQVPSNETDGIDPDWLERYGEMLKEREESFKKFKSLYTEYQRPFGLFANLENKNPIELWEILVYGNEPYIHCWSNPNEKLDDAVSLLQKGNLLVIDIISLLSIYKLGLADIAVQAFGKFGVAQSTLELLRNIVQDCQLYSVGGCSIFASVNGQQVIQSFIPDEVAQRKLYFEQLITWVRNNCLILPCERALTINRDERQELNNVFGSSFVDTIFIASEPGRILYSDDQWLRFYAKTNSGVQSVWTQVILNYSLQQKYIDNYTYCNATLQLIYWGYNYTPVNAEILLAAAKRAEWSLKPDYTVVLKVLENQLTYDEYILYIAAEFIYKLYNEAIFPIHRDCLIFELLKAITKYRHQAKTIEKLIYYIKSKSDLFFTLKKDILRVINIWVNTQLIIK